MNLSFALAVVVCLVGAVLYFVSAGKTQEAGRLMFVAGLLATLLKFAGSASLHIGS